MRFLIDEQLSPVIAGWIARRGFEALHVLDLNLLATPDRDIALRAIELNAVIVTKDQDYLDWQVRFDSLQILWLLIGNVSNRVTLARLEEVWPEVISRLESGEAIVTVGP